MNSGNDQLVEDVNIPLLLLRTDSWIHRFLFTSTNDRPAIFSFIQCLKWNVDLIRCSNTRSATAWGVPRKGFFPLGLNVTKQRWTQFRHGNTSFAVFDVRSCAAVGEADPILFIHANQRVLMRMYVHHRQRTEINIDDTFFASICANQAISRHGVPEMTPEIVKPCKSASLRTYIFSCRVLKYHKISHNFRRTPTEIVMYPTKNGSEYCLVEDVLEHNKKSLSQTWIN